MTSNNTSTPIIDRTAEDMVEDLHVFVHSANEAVNSLRAVLAEVEKNHDQAHTLTPAARRLNERASEMLNELECVIENAVPGYAGGWLATYK